MSAGQVLFVAGAHTEIGKTHVACALLQAARDSGRSVDVLKPVVSGFDPVAWADSDPGRLLAAAGRLLTLVNLDTISPWRLAAPLAPPMAAEAEGRALPFEAILTACLDRVRDSCADLLVVEGVGGLMSPIADGATGLDLLLALPGEVVLVGGGYLGAVSHTLTALEVLRARGRPPRAIIVSEDASAAAPDFLGSVALARKFVGETPLLGAARGLSDDWAGAVLDVALGPVNSTTHEAPPCGDAALP